MPDQDNTALQCLAALAGVYGLSADFRALAVKYEVAGKGVPDNFPDIAREAGFLAELRQPGWDGLFTGPDVFPAIAPLKNGNTVIFHDRLERDGQDLLLVVDPLADSGRPFEVDRQNMERNWDGSLFVLEPRRTHSLLRAFVLVARHLGVDILVEQLIRSHGLGSEDPDPRRLTRIARNSGFKVGQHTLKWEDFTGLGQAFPCIALRRDGQAVIITAPVDKDNEVWLDVLDPYAPRLRHESWSREEFERNCSGKVLLVKRLRRMDDDNQPFGLRWFGPEFLRQKRAFFEIALTAILLQALSLATPLYFQIVIDKVLTHQAVDTLHVLGIGMLVVLLFEAMFHFLRGYILIHATSKIDIRVATRTFAKLLSLPLFFFDRAAAGVLIKHMQQADHIRRFLTGKLFSTMLDGFALLVFLPILFFYSPLLAGIVVGFSLLMALVVAALLPTFRRRLQHLYNAEAARQSYLVESIQGMRAVKSLAMEGVRGVDWDRRAARSVNMNLGVGRVTVSANAFTVLLEKLMILAIPWVGVFLVFDGQMTVGALIAFQMIAGRVSGPLVQFVSLIHEYQEMALSVRMLGSIMNQPSERSRSERGLRPDVRGEIRFSDVTFRYTPDSPPALVNLNLGIPAGTMVGVVGRSGSGKSTLVRLLSGLYPCTEGVIRLDGTDIRSYDLGHLRSSVGIVLQDSFLFSGTVRENISAAKPDATFEDVVRSARLAGAEEFIERLPHGYDTMLEENGDNLSGGQKQRLAIARTLLTNPAVLVLDEATSALDAESEAIIQDNIQKISRHRTTLLISHRLSLLVQTDVILVMDEGRIVSVGTHDELLALDTGSPIYRTLWEKQHRHLLDRGRP